MTELKVLEALCQAISAVTGIAVEEIGPDLELDKELSIDLDRELPNILDEIAEILHISVKIKPGVILSQLDQFEENDQGITVRSLATLIHEELEL